MKRTGVLLVAALLLGGCGGYEPDMRSMERQLRDDLAEQIEAPARNIAVDCPSSVEWTAGSDFRCTAEDKRGNRVFITVYMENDDGEYTWRTS